MKFKFPYENLLHNKKLNRDVAFRNFAEARSDLKGAEDVLVGFNDDVHDSRVFRQELAQAAMMEKNQIEALKWTQEFIEGQQIKIQRQKQAIQTQQENVNAK